MKSIPRQTICSYSSGGYRLQLVLACYDNRPIFQVLLNRKIIFSSYDYTDAVFRFSCRLTAHTYIINPLDKTNNLFPNG